MPPDLRSVPAGPATPSLGSDGRLPPHSEEAERSVLASILLDPHCVSDVLEVLKPDGADFYRDAHRRIFATMASLSEKGEPIDLVTVTEALKGRGDLELVGGTDALAQLTTEVASAVGVARHARLVRERAILRLMIATSLEIASRAYEGTPDLDAFLDRAEREIFTIAEQRATRSLLPIREIMRAEVNRIAKLRDHRGATTGVPTGLRKLDELTSGFQPSDLVIVAGRPGMGKTALALNFAVHAAQQQTGVLVFSLEMNREQIAERMLCSEGGFNGNDLRRGRVVGHQWEEILQVAKMLAEIPIHIDDSAGMTVLEIRAKARRHKRENNLGLIVIDYLQLMRSARSTDSREQEIADISRSLKALAKELEVPVVALSQLSRKPEGRGREDRRPILSDLRESGALEQDADVVIFVYREDYYDDESPEKGTAEIIVAKQRNGPTDTLKVACDLKASRFRNLEESLPPVTGGPF